MPPENRGKWCPKLCPSCLVLSMQLPGGGGGSCSSCFLQDS
ncbi:hypothetical protein EI555_004923 [Monodon monoceros]|uniref:Uncharacterized protein n=1 Tax=Monodon monoceros TaxID=40151 RepID=A0A4U1FAR7_MONMO|nr:hypothetical protein EI555_004923 [Monodon monoceros]